MPEPLNNPESADRTESPDLALLSAYLDGALTPGERAALDQRLRAEPALQATLDGLRQIQTILQAAPILTVPRDFVLDPALHGRGSQFRPPRQPIRLFGTLGAVAAIAAALVIAFGLTSTNRQPLGANAVLIASNPTIGATTVLQAAQADKMDTTATLAGRLSDNSSQLQATNPPTPLRVATEIAGSATPLALKTQPPPVVAASLPPASPLPATAAPAAAAQQSGSAATSGQGGASGGQDAAATSIQPNSSAPVAPSNGGIAPVAPSVLIAATATLRQTAVVPTNAPSSIPTNVPTRAKAAPSAQPPSAENQPVPVVTNLPALLKIIWWLVITVFAGKGLS